MYRTRGLLNFLDTFNVILYRWFTIYNIENMYFEQNFTQYFELLDFENFYKINEHIC